MPARAFGDGDPEAAVAALIAKLPAAVEDVTLEQYEDVAATRIALAGALEAASGEADPLESMIIARAEERGARVVGEVMTADETEAIKAIHRRIARLERAIWALDEWNHRAGVPGFEAGPQEPRITEGPDGEMLLLVSHDDEGAS